MSFEWHPSFEISKDYKEINASVSENIKDALLKIESKNAKITILKIEEHPVPVPVKDNLNKRSYPIYITYQVEGEIKPKTIKVNCFVLRKENPLTEVYTDLAMLDESDRISEDAAQLLKLNQSMTMKDFARRVNVIVNNDTSDRIRINYPRIPRRIQKIATSIIGIKNKVIEKLSQLISVSKPISPIVTAKPIDPIVSVSEPINPIKYKTFDLTGPLALDLRGTHEMHALGYLSIYETRHKGIQADFGKIDTMKIRDSDYKIPNVFRKDANRQGHLTVGDRQISGNTEFVVENFCNYFNVEIKDYTAVNSANIIGVLVSQYSLAVVSALSRDALDEVWQPKISDDIMRMVEIKKDDKSTYVTIKQAVVFENTQDGSQATKIVEVNYVIDNHELRDVTPEKLKSGDFLPSLQATSRVSELLSTKQKSAEHWLKLF